MTRSFLHLLGASLVGAFCFGSAFATNPVPLALLSVATEEATLELATPESLRPIATPTPVPYPDSVLEKLSDDALLTATAANAQVAQANTTAASMLAQADRDKREKRENAALHAFSQSELGRAVAKAPGVFREEVARTQTVSLLRVGEDGYVAAPESARLVRLHFGIPRKSASASAVPGTSNAPVSLALTMTMKIESSDGRTLATETFDQSASFTNSDELLGASYVVAVEKLVKAATKAAAEKAAENR